MPEITHKDLHAELQDLKIQLQAVTKFIEGLEERFAQLNRAFSSQLEKRDRMEKTMNKIDREVGVLEANQDIMNKKLSRQSRILTRFEQGFGLMGSMFPRTIVDDDDEDDLNDK